MVKINFKTHCNTPDEDLERNKAYAKSLGFPRIGEAKRPRLAVVGGGSSVLEHVDTLRNWDGEIIAINRAWQWCNENGIDAIFCTAEARVSAAKIVSGVKKALISMACCPELFDELMNQNADIEAVYLGPDTGVPSGPTTVCAFMITFFDRGCSHVTFFGCEGSWDDKSHVYEDKSNDGIYQVKVGEETFLTQPYMMMQSEMLAAVINAVPQLYQEKSGGLLAALIKNPDMDLIAATPDVHAIIAMNEEAKI